MQNCGVIVQTSSAASQARATEVILCLGQMSPAFTRLPEGQLGQPFYGWLKAKQSFLRPLQWPFQLDFRKAAEAASKKYSRVLNQP
jgi:hypothetical protein